MYSFSTFNKIDSRYILVNHPFKVMIFSDLMVYWISSQAVAGNSLSDCVYLYHRLAVCKLHYVDLLVYCGAVGGSRGIPQ